MSNIDDMVARVKITTPTKHLIRLTNLNDTSASAIDDTVLEGICKEVNGDFLKHGVGEYDDTEHKHHAAAKQGIFYRLRLSIAGGKRTDELKTERDEYERELKDLAEATGRAHLEPVTDSNYTPSTPPEGKPPFDDEVFRGVL